MKQQLFSQSKSFVVSNARGALAKIAGAAALGTAFFAAAPADAAPMRVEGNRLLDACGQVFVVRGVEQILGRELPPGNDWLGLIEQISTTGANAVRILPGVNTLTVADVDAVLTLVGQKGMVAFIDPLNSPDNWFARADVKTMLKKHESYIIIDAYGEPQYDDRDTWRSEAADALREVRSLGYKVPLTVTANGFGRDLPSLFEYGDEVLAADPIGNTFLGWQAYWGQGGYYQGVHGLSLSAAVDAIVDSGLPIQMGLDHITDLPSEAADFGTLMNEAEVHQIGWLWWDWFNPYGSENNLSEDGSSANLTTTGSTVVNTHYASIANTAHLTCSGEVEEDDGFVRIDAGGTGSGAWGTDQFFTGGSVSARSTAAIDRSGVASAAPELVYQTDRRGTTMQYLAVGFAPKSKHTVRLHFAETQYNRAGKRLFNVKVNGALVLLDFDVYATAGAKNRAVVQSFQTKADKYGRILIKLGARGSFQAAVSGIVIE